MTQRWTVVQHSAYGYKSDPQFRRGLELRAVTSPEVQRLVRSIGGLLFDDYETADKFTHEEEYPPGYGGIYPQAPGTFSEKGVDGLAIYLQVGVEK